MRKALVALALAAALASRGPNFLDHAWSLLTSVWGTSCSDGGLIMDPNGGCRPAPQADAGLIMDQDGKPGL